MNYQKEFDFAVNLAEETGRKICQLNNKEVISQEGKDTKAEADFISEEHIMKNLQETFDYPILSEESYKDFHDDGQTPYWIIDPIDGTLNYTRGVPLSCISIAFWVDNKPIFGVIYDFNRDEMIKGYVKAGTWLDDEELSSAKKISKGQSILGTGFSTYINLEGDQSLLIDFIKQIKAYKKVRILGSAALSLAYVACDRFNAYLEKDIKLWDVAAGLAILKSLDIPYNIEPTGNYCFDVYGYNHKD